MRLPARGRAGADLPRGVGGRRGAHGVDERRALRRAATRATIRARCRRARSTPRSTRRADYGRGRARAVARHAGVRPDGRRADDVHARRGSTRGPDAADAMPVLNAARAIKTEQEIERMRLANEICAAAMEHVRGELRPGMKESEAAAIWQGVRARRGHGLEGQGRPRARLLARLVGRGHQDLHGDRRPCRCRPTQPTLFEIWVCADGYWCDHTKLLCPGELRADYRELEDGLLDVYAARDRPLPAGRELGRARPSRARGDRRDRLPGAAVAPDLPRRRRARARAAVRAPGGRRRRSRRAWCSRSSRAATGRAAAACASRTTS